VLHKIAHAGIINVEENMHLQIDSRVHAPFFLYV
jgi:hypothetical protein